MTSANVGLCAIVFVTLGVFLVNASPLNSGRGLIGAKQCTWGPSYWCGNLTNAKNCNAVRHCIQTIWEKQSVPVDNDSICQICKDMVTQARDQLRSNETMEELKEVLEGSCNLIPIKPVKKECCRLADDFIPELVEALSSQMNPDQVCSVAGLCNNARIDELLMTYYSGALDGTLKEEKEDHVHIVKKSNECDDCKKYGKDVVEKFRQTNREDIKENFIHWCGGLSSFSEGCANIVLTYFDPMYEHLNKHLSADGLCHLSGYCIVTYHTHPEIEQFAETKNELGDIIRGTYKEDIPCELCQQLVLHLRDVLIANTTEEEFKMVLDGFCNQTKGFRQECLSIIDQYYDVIYKMMTSELDPKGACLLIGVCPRTPSKQASLPVLLPIFPPAEIKVTIKKLGVGEPKFNHEELNAMQLPIDRLMGAANPSQLVENGQLCTLCEYLLHFIQETLATPTTDDEIKHTVENICKKLPNSVRGECHNFIDMYGDACIALLIQDLNPRSVCPKLQMCPSNLPNHNDVEVFKPETFPDETDKPTCPLCLFAVEQAQMKIKDDKSKKNIRNVLDHLCAPLPQKLQAECVDFIETYSNELIDKLVSDFQPQEICVDIKLCPSSNSYLSDLGINVEDDDKSSSEEIFNEIDGSNELPLEIVFKQDQDAVAPNCWLCEEFVKNAEKRINKNMSKAEIERALQHACDKLRKNMQPKCHKYIERYGDKIADLILKELTPKMICRELGLCLWSEQEDLEIDEALKYDVVALPNEKSTDIGHSERLTGVSHEIVMEPPTCVLCEFVMTKLETELNNKTEQDEIKRTIEKICQKMPKTVAHSCEKFVDQYANAIIALIGSVPPKEVCQKLQLCSTAEILKAITGEVVECGVCHGASMALLKFSRQRTDSFELDIHDMVSVGCEQLPSKYYQICTDMISIYGPSIMNLSKKSYVDETHICAEIGKCFNNEKSGLAFASIIA